MTPKPTFPHFFCAAALSSLLLLGACKHKETVEQRDPVRVELIAIDSANDGLTRTFVGEVEARESIALSFPTGGKVEQVLVHEGDPVHAGQKLVTVNKSTAQHAYNSAKAQLDQAEDAYKRLKKVYEQGSLAEVKWVEMLTALEKARSLEQIAKKQLADCALIAPSSGVIGECNAKAGGSLIPGEPAVTILDVSRVAVTFSVPESEIASICEGQEVSVCVPALNDLQLSGKITERSMNASKVSHSYDVKVDLPNADKKLLPGMVCKVHLQVPDSRGIVVPAKCVQTRPDGQCVWVVRNGKAERRNVTASEFVSNGVLITSGLHPGDSVVTAGMEKLYGGATTTQ